MFSFLFLVYSLWWVGYVLGPGCLTMESVYQKLHLCHLKQLFQSSRSFSCLLFCFSGWSQVGSWELNFRTCLRQLGQNAGMVLLLLTLLLTFLQQWHVKENFISICRSLGEAECFKDNWDIWIHGSFNLLSMQGYVSKSVRLLDNLLVPV